MTTSVSTQCDNMDQENLEDKSTSNTKSARSMMSTILQDYIDLEDPYDLERMKTWCQVQWFSIFRNVFANRNIIKYHTCCNSFSRRQLSKSSAHPPDQTLCLMKVPAFRNIANEEDFFRWLLKLAKENARYGMKTLFPSMNRRHPDFGDTDDDSGRDSEAEVFLKKRCKELQKEVEDQKRLVKDLLEDNNRLLNSSKAWHSRYQELLDSHDTAMDYLATPVKKRLSNSPLFLYN